MTEWIPVLVALIGMFPVVSLGLLLWWDEKRMRRMRNG